MFSVIPLEVLFMFTRTIGFSLVIHATFLSLSSLSAKVEGDLAYLEVVSRGMQANYESISTWCGAAQIKHLRSNSEIAKKEIGFAIDASNRRIRTNVTTTFQGSSKRQFLSHMLKGDERFAFGPFEFEDRSNRDAWTLILKADPDGALNLDNPLAFFQLVGNNLPEFLSEMSRDIDEAEASEIDYQVSRSGALVTFALSGFGATNRYVFDDSKGYNLVSYFSKDSELEENWKFEFEEHDGTFVPSKWSHSKKRKGEKADQIECNLKDNRVNAPLNDAQFTLASLGLVRGDLVRDTIRGVTLTYPSSDLNETLERHTSDRNWWKTAGVVGIAIVLVFVWQGWRKSS